MEITSGDLGSLSNEQALEVALRFLNALAYRRHAH
jgi:hypothetical protein